MTVVDWLLDSDPAIRWQVMQDLTDASPDEVAAERAKVATEGWGAQILAAQDPDGRWSGGTFFPEWISTTDALHTLYLFGLDPTSEQARRAIAPVHEAARWEYDENLRYLGGRGRAVHQRPRRGHRCLFRPGHRRDRRAVAEDQMADGGWNCEQERGSVRGSVRFNHQRPGGAAGVRARDRREWRGDRRSHPWRGIPAAAAAPASTVGRRDPAEAVAGRRIPEQVVLRRGARARLLPRRASGAGRADGRGAGHRRVEADR